MNVQATVCREKANEITTISNTMGTEWVAPGFDKAGNMSGWESVVCDIARQRVRHGGVWFFWLAHHCKQIIPQRLASAIEHPLGL